MYLRDDNLFYFPFEHSVEEKDGTNIITVQIQNFISNVFSTLVTN